VQCEQLSGGQGLTKKNSSNKTMQSNKICGMPNGKKLLLTLIKLQLAP